ncbi:hypothetical protein SESBI_19572 [Sesbania bispinosa]|nr:hypothetical protein SESBI_19572 [Sesbania bispinosa]
MATSADFLASNWRKSFVERDTRNNASELTLWKSLSRVIIFFTRPLMNSDWDDTVFSYSSAITTSVNTTCSSLKKISLLRSYSAAILVKTPTPHSIATLARKRSSGRRHSLKLEN